jgi:hypothetical protein
MSKDRARKIEWARRLWAECRPLAGTPAEFYLRARSITIPTGPAVAFHGALKHPGSNHPYPCMVAAVTDAVGQIFGIHRTFLAASGKRKADVTPAKMMAGVCLGKCVRFGRPGEESGYVLAIGEGIESCLSVRQATGLPIWAALSLSPTWDRFPCPMTAACASWSSWPMPMRRTVRPRMLFASARPMPTLRRASLSESLSHLKELISTTCCASPQPRSRIDRMTNNSSDDNDGPRMDVSSDTAASPAPAAGADEIRKAVASAKPYRRRLTLVQGQAAKPDAGLKANGSATTSASRGRGMAGGGGKLRGSRADRSVTELISELDLWHAPKGEPYAAIAIDGHRENWPINSERFKGWLRWRARRRGEPLMGATDIEKVTGALAAEAIYTGPRHEVWTRVGEANGNIYVDLGREDWRCIEIAPTDLDSDRPCWEILTEAPLKFVRRPGMREMTMPAADGDIDLLRGFLNVEEGDFRLVVGWMLSSYRPRGPYPILVINGTQESGKSNMLRLLSRLVDPTQAPERNLPKEERDLFVAAMSSHLQTFDNLSSISGPMADALCRLATGGGFSSRSLHTNNEQHIMQACKPVLLNGIPDLTRRGDIADRSIVVTAARLTADRRRPEEDFWSDFRDCEPQILGALFNAIGYALRTYAVTPAPSVRMADAARFMSAGGKAFGWEHDTIGKLLYANRLQAIDTVIDSDPFALALLDLLNEQPDWRGTTTELLTILTERVPDKVRRSKAWPMTPSGARGALDRIKDAIEAKGFSFERGHEKAKDKRFVQFKSID